LVVNKIKLIIVHFVGEALQAYPPTHIRPRRAWHLAKASLRCRRRSLKRQKERTGDASPSRSNSSGNNANGTNNNNNNNKNNSNSLNGNKKNSATNSSSTSTASSSTPPPQMQFWRKNSKAGRMRPKQGLRRKNDEANFNYKIHLKF
jgi:hypothetical protein